MDRDAAIAHFTGPVSSLTTPFQRDGEVDYQGLRRIVDALIDHGCPVLILTAGDSHLICLSDQEIAQVTRVTCEQAAGRAVVVAADRFHATSRAVDFARYAVGAGADAVMTLPPDWAASCTVDLLVEHYAAVGREAPVVMVTNFLGAHGDAFGLEVIERTVDGCPSLVAIKDDLCGDFARRLCLRVDGRVATFAGGRKSNHLNMWPYGATGYMSTYQIYGAEIPGRYWQAVTAGDLATAREVIRDHDMPYFELMSGLTGGWNAGRHACLELFGLAGRWRRPPYYSLTDREMAPLRAFFVERGLLD